MPQPTNALLSARLPRHVAAALDALAAQRKQSRADVAREIIMRALEHGGLLAPIPVVDP